MNKLTLDKQEANNIVCGEHPDWVMIEGTEEGGEVHKMTQEFEAVFEHKPSGKFYVVNWYVFHDDWGFAPFEYNEPVFTEVKLYKETVVVETWKVVDHEV